MKRSEESQEHKQFLRSEKKKDKQEAKKRKTLKKEKSPTI